MDAAAAAMTLDAASEARLWRRVKTSPDCWEWIGIVDLQTQSQVLAAIAAPDIAAAYNALADSEARSEH